MRKIGIKKLPVLDCDPVSGRPTDCRLQTVHCTVYSIESTALSQFNDINALNGLSDPLSLGQTLYHRHRILLGLESLICGSMDFIPWIHTMECIGYTRTALNTQSSDDK